MSNLQNIFIKTGIIISLKNISIMAESNLKNNDIMKKK